VTGPPLTTPPPKWKTALVTLAAVFPPVLVFNVAVIPFLGGVSVVLRTLTLCVAVTAVVTWVMMPRLMRLLKDWLHPPADETAQSGAPGRVTPRSRAARRSWAGGDGKPAWLLETAPTERDADPEPWYDAPREAAPRRPARPARGWDDDPPYQDNRRPPWYGRQQPWYGRPTEGEYYDEPDRYDTYDEPERTPARDRGPGTGRYRR
jgi:hypothetical protein